MSWSTSRGDIDPGTLVEATGGVDGIDTNNVGAQIRREKERTRGVEEYLVRVWSVLTSGVWTGFGQRICKCLDRRSVRF